RQAVVTGMIKVSASDMAGNVVAREFNLNTLPTAQVTHLPEPGAISPIPQIDDKQMRPVAGSDKLIPLPGGMTKTASPLPTVEDKNYVINPVRPIDTRNTEPGGQIKQAVSPFPQGTTATTAPSPVANHTAPQPPNKQIVSNTHVFLDYQIEQMGAS